MPCGWKSRIAPCIGNLSKQISRWALEMTIGKDMLYIARRSGVRRNDDYLQMCLKIQSAHGSPVAAGPIGM